MPRSGGTLQGRDRLRGPSDGVMETNCWSCKRLIAASSRSRLAGRLIVAEVAGSQGVNAEAMIPKSTVENICLGCLLSCLCFFVEPDGSHVHEIKERCTAPGERSTNDQRRESGLARKDPTQSVPRCVKGKA